MLDTNSSQLTVNAATYASDGSYTISCADVASSSVWVDRLGTSAAALISSISRTGCSYTITSAAGQSTLGAISFPVHYTSSGGGVIQGVIPITVRQKSDISFRAPTLSLPAGRTLVIDAGRYASDGAYSITCGTATSVNANLTVSNTGCSYAITAGGTLGAASFTVPYTSSGSDTHNGVVSITITSTYPGAIIPLSATGCTDGTFVNLTTDPRVSGNNNDLVEDCQALVAMQNHWAAIEENHSLGSNHKLRSWGTGTATQKMVENWAGITVNKDYTFGSFLATAPRRVTVLDLANSIFASAAAQIRISGNIPAEIGNLNRLIELDLTENNLSGPIIAELANLRYLQRWKMGHNQLSGSIPSEISLFRQTPSGASDGLRDIQFNNNQLSGSIPFALTRVSTVGELDLSNNKLSGAIPSALTTMANLSGMRLSNNRLTGAIPATWWAQTYVITESGGTQRTISVDFEALRRLYLDGNLLSGSIPSGLKLLRVLGTVHLANNQFTGSIPSNFDFGSLAICGNYLTGAVPAGQQFGGGSSLVNYPRSEGFDPVACQRSGTPDLPAISAYPLIPKLAASDCSGRFLPAAAPATAVSDCEILVTAQNLWADEAANRNLPDDHFLRTWGRGSTVEIGNWEGVTFSDWRVTGLSLASKNLRGSVPSQLGDLSAMTSLDISSNRLSGSLPGELDRLTAAGSLTSANVLLTGSLTSFDFCSNHLSGSISATLVAQDSGVTFGAAAEAVRTQLIADQMMVCQRTGSVPAAAERQLGFTYAKALAGGATVQGLHAGLGLEPDAVISRWNTTTSAWVAITCSQRDAANECTGAWTPATLAADTVVRYEDGYADSATLTPLKLERVASPEPVAAVSVSFSTPATFALQGGNTLVIDARNYIADAGLGITCADATSVGTKLNSVTRSGCVYTAVAKTGSANEGAASFTIPFTPTGRSAQNGVVSVTVTPASDLAISQPSALAVRAGVSTTIDVGSLVTDGDYAITCRDATQMHSRITTVSRTAGSCSFAITAGASRAAVTRGDATITVPFASTGGGLTSFQIQLEVSKIAYTAPTDLRIEAVSKTLEIDASEFAADGSYTFTCSDASSLTGNLATVAHTGDSCTFTATTTSSTATGAASFTTTYTSSGGDVLEAVIPVTVGPARNIVFTAPTALAIGAGGTLVFDVSSYATDGDFWEITCGDSTAKTSRIASVTRIGDTCEFRVRAGSEEGTASFTVPYISENGATISGVVPVVVGTAASIVFAPPAASFPTGLNVEASKSIVIDASAYASDGSYTISCGDATNNSALWQSVVRDSGGNGCSFTATARAGVSGPASFTVPYSSSGGGSLNGRISVFIRPLSDIVFTAPPTTGRFSLTVLSGRVLVLDVAGYAADGDYEISCTSAAAAADAGITVENSGCSVAITGGMAAGSASFTVGYMSSGGDTHAGTVALSVSRAVSGTAVPLLSNAGCTDGTFVNLTTNPRVTGANNDLAEDCMALVAIQNHFAGFEANRDLGEFHAFREWGDASTEWGTGTASDRLVQNWLDITVTGGRVTDWHIGVQAGVVFGTLPSEFQNLTALERLDFDDHKLSGNLPSWLGSMSALDDVDLSGNNFSGPIPSELGNLSSLQFLNLAQNELSGSIPSQLGSLSNLVRLYLDRNQLTGSIPSQLGSLSSTAFRQLNLSDNRLSGSIPSQLTSLTALRNLLLNNNLLTGGIPSGIGSLTSLITLDLNSNRLSGSIPTGISSLTNLFRLNLSNNQITGAIPAAVGNLVTLNAAGNRFTGVSLVYICGNYFTGPVPTGLQQTASNQYVLWDYPISEGFNPVACQKAPEELVSDYPVIPKLSAGGCVGGGYLPALPSTDMVSDCQTLVAVQNHWADVADNRNLGADHFLRTWGQGSSQLINLWEGVTLSSNRVISLNLGNKGLRGSVPWQLGSLSGLITLDISNNYLDGELPYQLGFLSSVRSLGQVTTGSLSSFRFCFNYFTGDIPAALLDADANIIFGVQAEFLRANFATDASVVCQLSGVVPDSPVRIAGISYAEVLSGGAQAHLVRSRLGLDSDSQVFRWDADNSLWTLVPELICTQRNAADECTRRAQNQASLAEGTLIYYSDGYADRFSLARANLIDGLSPSESVADILFTPPVVVPLQAGESVYLNAAGYLSGSDLAFTCADATGPAIDDSKLTITRLGCSYYVTAATPSPISRTSEDVTFNVVYTPAAPGATATNGVVTVRILPASSIAFAAPQSLFVGVSSSTVIDAIYSASDGPYAITCGDATSIDSTKFSSVARSTSGNGCSFTVTSTTSLGDGTFTVPYSSSGGDTGTGTFTVNVNNIVFASPTNLSVAAGRSIEITADSYVTDGANTFTCADATAIDSTKISSVTRNGCVFTVTAAATAAGESVTITVPVTSSGGASRTIVIPIAITPVSDLVFTAPVAVKIGAGNTKTIDVGAYAEDGDYTVSCSFQQSTRHARLTSVAVSGCSFTLVAGSTQGAATLAVEYESSGGDTLSATINLSIGPPSSVSFTAPSALAVGRNRTLTINALDYVRENTAYAVSCSDATGLQIIPFTVGVRFMSVTRSTSGDGCTFTVDPLNTLPSNRWGNTTFMVVFTSEGGSSVTGTFTINIGGDVAILFTDPGAFTIGRNRTFTIDATDHVEDGANTITCADATGVDANRMAVTRGSGANSCVYTVDPVDSLAASLQGETTFSAAFTSSGGSSTTGTFTVNIGPSSNISVSVPGGTIPLRRGGTNIKMEVSRYASDGDYEITCDSISSSTGVISNSTPGSCLFNFTPNVRRRQFFTRLDQGGLQVCRRGY